MPDAERLAQQVEEEIAELKKEQHRIEDHVRKMDEKMGTLGVRPAYLDEVERPKDGEEKDGQDKNDKKSRSRSRSRSRDRRSKKPDPRAKAMMKAMLGHLGAARKRLTKDADSAKEMQDVKRKELEEAKERATEKISEVVKQINDKELVLLQHKLEHHYSLMGNFIKTKTSPTIFYMPAKQTEETERLLEDTRAAIDNKISALQVPGALAPLPADVYAARAAAAAAAANADLSQEYPALRDGDDGEAKPRKEPKIRMTDNDDESEEDDKDDKVSDKDDEEMRNGDDGEAKPRKDDESEEDDKEDKEDEEGK
mmetsp:Transcript_60248/g.111711  ORF Transcript_60248/g.111711 Transcript_60248/m.111711 type:complete len:311 (-) Transcript_60248:115-1047(-)